MCGAPVVAVASIAYKQAYKSKTSATNTTTHRYTDSNFSAWDLSRYSCSQQCLTPTVSGVPDGCGTEGRNGSIGPDGQPLCLCPRALRTVGRYTLTSHAVPAPAWPAGCAYGGLTVADGNGVGGVVAGTATAAHVRGLHGRTGHGCLSGPAFATIPVNGSAGASNPGGALGACCDMCTLHGASCGGYRLVRPPGAGIGAAAGTAELFAGQREHAAVAKG